MTAQLNSAAQYKNSPFLADSMQFQRKSNRMKPKKSQKKKKLRSRHFLFMLILICALFLLLQQTYLFLITWDNLNVKTIEINCENSDIFTAVSRFFNEKNLGSILLLDITKLQDSLKERPLIKDIRIRKVFPSTLKVAVFEREPSILIKKDRIYLIDREGILIKVASPSEEGSYPLLLDSENFRTQYREKLELAWECLDSISEDDKSRIESMDVSKEYKLSVFLKDSTIKLYMDRGRFAEQFVYFHNIRKGLKQYGDLEYVDLRFQDRIYLRNKSVYNDELSKTSKGDQ
ncbi:cell division protein FtsQ/DivIB [Acidobacteriota bacterium]